MPPRPLTALPVRSYRLLPSAGRSCHLTGLLVADVRPAVRPRAQQEQLRSFSAPTVVGLEPIWSTMDRQDPESMAKQMRRPVGECCWRRSCRDVLSEHFGRLDPRASHGHQDLLTAECTLNGSVCNLVCLEEQPAVHVDRDLNTLVAEPLLDHRPRHLSAAGRGTAGSWSARYPVLP